MAKLRVLSPVDFGSVAEIKNPLLGVQSLVFIGCHFFLLPLPESPRKPSNSRRVNLSFGQPFVR